MIGIDSLIAVWVGRFMCGLFVCTGVEHLWPPPPPSAYEEMHAMFLFLVAMVPLATGEVVACYLDLISTTSEIKNRTQRLRELQRLQGAVFGSVIGAASAVTKVFKSTVQVFGHNND
jgi:hypothetical protein